MEDNKEDFSEIACNAVEKDFYVNDLLKSVKSVNTAIKLITEVVEILSRGGFRITKWMSNSREVLAAIPQQERAKPTLDLDLDELPVERALGVLWDVEQDVFKFKVVNVGYFHQSVLYLTQWDLYVLSFWKRRT